MISYAQNHEDVVLNRVFQNQSKGFYIDVGAYHPIHDSVTYYFYQRGWQGINIEPHVEYYREFEHVRPRDINLNLAVSNRQGPVHFYHCTSVPNHEGINGLSSASWENVRRLTEVGCMFEEHTVEAATLDQICSNHVRSTIDFLTIDVEGHEGEVLQGIDLTRWRPRVILVEDTAPVAIGVSAIQNQFEQRGKWEDILFQADYQFALFDGVNRFYVRSEEPEMLSLLQAPANALDNFVPYRQILVEEALQNLDRLVNEQYREITSLKECVDYLTNRYEVVKDVGPTCLNFARKAQNIFNRFPNVKSRLKYLVPRLFSSLL